MIAWLAYVALVFTDTGDDAGWLSVPTRCASYGLGAGRYRLRLDILCRRGGNDLVAIRHGYD